MESNITNISSSNVLFDTASFLPRSVRFSLTFIVNIPSTFCSFFVLHHFLTKHTVRTALHNHMIIVLLLAILIVQLIDMPLYLQYLYLGFVWPQTSTMCLAWWYIDICFYDTIVILLAWTSFERHILIFHSKLVSSKKKRWIFHYFLMIFFIIYPLSFYLFALLIPSRENKFLFDYTEGWCNYRPCYYDNDILNLYDTLMNAAIPCLLIALFSIVLIIRVAWRKYVRFHRPIELRKYRKMTVQLLLIASYFLTFNVPLLIYYLMDTCGSLPLDVDYRILQYFLFSANFSVLLLPFVIFFSVPKKYTWKRCQNLLQNIRQRRIVIHPN